MIINTNPPNPTYCSNSQIYALSKICFRLFFVVSVSQLLTELTTMNPSQGFLFCFFILSFFYYFLFYLLSLQAFQDSWQFNLRLLVFPFCFYIPLCIRSLTNENTTEHLFNYGIRAVIYLSLPCFLLHHVLRGLPSCSSWLVSMKNIFPKP